MAPPQWAYQVENFDPPPDEELLCSICTAVFCEPVQCPCNHVFCRSCITKWLQSNHNCPVCRKRATKYSLQGVLPLVKNMIMKLTLNCHNSEHGCDEKTTLEGCESHLKSCKFEMVQCKNKPCKQKLFRKDINDHEFNGCPHRYVKCQKCSLKISSLSPDEHNCVKGLISLLKRKDNLLKKKNCRIANLQKEIKKLKQAERDRQSDYLDISSGSDFERSESSSDISVESHNDDDNSSDSEEDDVYYNIQVQDDMLRPIDDISVIDLNSTEDGATNNHDSIELPRSTNSVVELDSSNAVSFSHDFISSVSEVAQSSFEETPQPRRPIKRRHPPAPQSSVSDPSDDESSLSHSLISLPTSKRCWSNSILDDLYSGPSDIFESTRDEISQNRELDNSAVGDSSFMQSPIGQASSSTSSSTQMSLRSRSSSRNKYRRSSANVNNPRSDTLSETDSSLGQASAAQTSFHQRAFEKTLALLDQYNWESDPEWLPMEVREVREHASNSSNSDSSSTSSSFFIASCSSSADSSLDEMGPVEFNGDNPISLLVQREITESSEEEDPDWMP